MRSRPPSTLALLFPILLVACTKESPAPAPAEGPRSVAVAEAGAPPLQVKPAEEASATPTSPPAPPAASGPRVGWQIDDDAVHSVPSETAQVSVRTYPTIGILRVVSATKDAVTFKFNDGPGQARFAGKPGQIDVAAFPAGKMFIGGLSHDPTSLEQSPTGTWAMVSVASETDAKAMLKYLEATRTPPPMLKGGAGAGAGAKKAR